MDTPSPVSMKLKMISIAFITVNTWLTDLSNPCQIERYTLTF